MEKQVQIYCPNCGAIVNEKGKCEFCGTQMDAHLFELTSVKMSLPKGIYTEGTCRAYGKFEVWDSNKYGEYKYGIASNKGILLPCIYKIPYFFYDDKICVIEKGYKAEEKGLYSLINDKLLIPCKIWSSEPFINTRYVKCQIDIKYGILDLETFEFVLPCIYSKISIIKKGIKKGVWADIELMGKHGLVDMQMGVWDVRKLDFVLPMGRHIPFTSKSTDRYIAVDLCGSGRRAGVWDIKEQKFAVPCKYDTIDEIDPTNNVVKARNFGIFGDKHKVIQL